MSTFAENLQYYRKKGNITQEQLAEKMDVSRQTVSKWEAGTTYPEMEKILQLCDMFSCDMDTLLRRCAGDKELEDNKKHRERMGQRKKRVTLGAFLFIADAALYEVLTGFFVSSAVCDTIFMMLVIVGVLILVVEGMQHDNYRKKYPALTDFFSEEEKERVEKRAVPLIASGIGMIFIGLLFGMNSENLPLRQGMNTDFYDGICILLVAVAVGVLIYAGLEKEMYDIDAYNKRNLPDKNSSLTGIWCGCIMLAASAVYVITGFAFEIWYINWIVYPIGGILCGIAVLILKGMNKKKAD